MSTPYVLAYRCSLQQEPICRGIETQFTFTCNVIDAVHYNNNAYKPIANIYVERDTAELERLAWGSVVQSAKVKIYLNAKPIPNVSSYLVDEKYVIELSTINSFNLFLIVAF